MNRQRLIISIHDRCQYSCQFCVYLRGNPVTTIGLDVWQEILRQAKQQGYSVVEVGGRGEPTLSKDFIEIVTQAYSLGFRIELLSNAQHHGPILQVLPMLHSITINLNALNEEDFYKIHKPAGDISFRQCTASIGKVITESIDNNYAVDFKINYVVSRQSMAAAPSFPEKVNKLFAEQLGDSRHIDVNYQFFHSYVADNLNVIKDGELLSKMMALFQLSRRNTYLNRYSNVDEFLGKANMLRAWYEAHSAEKESADKAKDDKTSYFCEIFKEAVFIDNNGDVYGCFNPFRVPNGLDLAEDPFYLGNVLAQGVKKIISDGQIENPVIDVAKPFWTPCLACKAKNQ